MLCWVLLYMPSPLHTILSVSGHQQLSQTSTPGLVIDTSLLVLCGVLYLHHCTPSFLWVASARQLSQTSTPGLVIDTSLLMLCGVLYLHHCTSSFLWVASARQLSQTSTPGLVINTSLLMLWGNYSFTTAHHPHCVWRATVITYVNNRSSYRDVTTSAVWCTIPSPLHTFLSVSGVSHTVITYVNTRSSCKYVTTDAVGKLFLYHCTPSFLWVASARQLSHTSTPGLVINTSLLMLWGNYSFTTAHHPFCEWRQPDSYHIRQHQV